jgi:predicted Zn-dependent protease
VDKTLFLNILTHYAATSADEAKEIVALRKEFPYSQVLHTLCARASKDHGFQSQQRDLQLAAVYAADRGVLKDIVTREPESPLQQIISKHINAEEQVVSTLDSVDVADVVMDDLERLSMVKHTFENLFMDYPRSGDDNQARHARAEQPKTEVPSESAKTPTQTSTGTSPIKSKKERIVEMAKAMSNGTGETVPSKKKPLDKNDAPADELIAHIQTSKQEIVPENERQKQQIAIINQFIRVQPSISNPKDRQPPAAGDLMPIKSGEFGDHIVSETLVEILIKQGKKDKAIEVLKKLIWKYPQKKAYFASQIEELKK